MRGPAETGRGGVSMAGGREGQGARKGYGVRGQRLPSPACFLQNLRKMDRTTEIEPDSKSAFMPRDSFVPGRRVHWRKACHRPMDSTA